MDIEDFPSFEFDEEERVSRIPDTSSIRTETIDLGAFNDLTASGSYDLSEVHASALGKIVEFSAYPCLHYKPLLSDNICKQVLRGAL